MASKPYASTWALASERVGHFQCTHTRRKAQSNPNREDITAAEPAASGENDFVLLQASGEYLIACINDRAPSIDE
jgi:hypothetical protein